MQIYNNNNSKEKEKQTILFLLCFAISTYILCMSLLTPIRLGFCSVPFIINRLLTGSLSPTGSQTTTTTTTK
jgi:hypothetical protein